ncbi:Polysaccharide deacetylase [Novymonas esmeraldas]|uniref:Polysaccharide deacetylase n=1 Tax=Novymonas esmeraldas TaxID=1808958 RepID=A0AAW0ELV0_9TRYP
MPTNDVDVYERDLLGYGGQPPPVCWPNGAHVAVSFVINYEEGAERTVLNGDTCSEQALSDLTGAAPVVGARCPQIESMYEYGSRAGFWRLRNIFAEAGVPVTVFGVAQALERNPAAVAAMRELEWEVATHGYRWIDYRDVPVEEEQAHLRLAIEAHTAATGARPVGHYIGRTSPNSARLCALDGGFLYSSDSYADDLPYYTQPLRRHGGDTGCQLIVPYALDTNDRRFVVGGFTESQQFFQYLKDNFDLLRDEGARGSPKMMSVGLHCRIAGKPARAAGLRRFVQYVQSTGAAAWVATRRQIAEHWLAHHPPPQPTFYQRTHAAAL